MNTRLFDLDLQLIVDSGLTILSLFFLFVALSYLLFEPTRQVLEGRRDKIKGQLEGAAADRESARILRLTYEEKLKEIDRESARLLDEARKKALANEKRSLEEARAEACRILDSARREAQLEKQKAAEDVKREMIVLASLLASKLVGACVDAAVQEALINETLQEVRESTWLS